MRSCEIISSGARAQIALSKAIFYMRPFLCLSRRSVFKVMFLSQLLTNRNSCTSNHLISQEKMAGRDRVGLC